jgi:hypothetical protein
VLDRADAHRHVGARQLGQGRRTFPLAATDAGKNQPRMPMGAPIILQLAIRPERQRHQALLLSLGATQVQARSVALDIADLVVSVKFRTFL